MYKNSHENNKQIKKHPETSALVNIKVIRMQQNINI